MNEPSPPAIKVTDLSVTLDQHLIIDNISFSIPDNSTTAIIGPNGAGKSVLLKTILRLIPKNTGQVDIFGTPHEQYRKISHLVSYIPQRINLDRHLPLTVQGLFSLKSSRPLGMSAAENKRMLNLLDMVGAGSLLTSRLHVLSGGQMQRILLAYSLMDNPKLLLLDEPAAGIDTQGQETIYPLLRRIQTRDKLTLVIISHELQIVMNYADQVLCLNKQLLCSGRPHKVLTNETLQAMYGGTVSHFEHQH